jgi:hypothetical protein
LLQDADVLLLDDCLAAVDAKVAAWILHHALLGPLLWAPGQNLGIELGGGQQQQEEQHQHQQQKRAVVVATHSPELLAAADWVVEMQDCRVAAVRQQPGAQQRRQDAAASAAAAGFEEGKLPDSLAAADGRGMLQEEVEEQQGQGQQERPKEQQQQQEERQQGHVRWQVYGRYAAATGWGWVTVILLSLLLMQASIGWLAPACCCCCCCWLNYHLLPTLAMQQLIPTGNTAPAVCVCRPPAMEVTCGCPAGCPTRLPVPSSHCKAQPLQARLCGAVAPGLLPAPAYRCLPVFPASLLAAATAAAAGLTAVLAVALAAAAAMEA